MNNYFENYIDNIDLNTLFGIAKLIGIARPQQYNKATIAALIKEYLLTRKVSLKFFNIKDLRKSQQVTCNIQILRQIEESLLFSHEVSDQLTKIWSCHFE